MSFSVKHIRGDLAGAVSVAALSIPLSLGTGLIAFAPLGAAFAPKAIFLSLVSLIISGVIPLLLRGNPIQYFGLSTSSAVLLADFISASLQKEGIRELSAKDPAAAVSLVLAGMAACIFLAGLFNVIYGFLRLGNIIKLFPQPVLAGAINGIAVMLISREVMKWFPSTFAGVPPLLLLALALGAALLTRRFLPWFPASVSGMALGIAAFFLVTAFFPGTNLGGNYGLLPDFHADVSGFRYLSDNLRSDLLVKLVPGALSTAFLISIITSITTLVSQNTVENFTFSREDPSRVLIQSGLIAMAGSVFLALPSDGSDSRIKLNYHSGGRTFFSPLFFSVLSAVFIILFFPYAGLVPRAVISGLVVYMAWLLLDSLTLHFLPRFFQLQRTEEGKQMRNHVIVSVFTAVLLLSSGFLASLMAGLSLALFFFLLQSQSSIIYRQSTARQIPSKTIRNSESMKLLETHGDTIRMLELQGPLFFGSVDALTKVAEDLKDSLDFLLLDFKRVSFSDSSAAMIIKRLRIKYASLGKHIAISGIHEGSQLWNTFRQFEIFSEKGEEVFYTMNEAQTWAEDLMLFTYGDTSISQAEIPLSESLMLNNFSPGEISQLAKYAVRKEFTNGEILMKEGEEADGIYLIVKGRAVVQKITEEGRPISIVRFGPGVSVGEAVLLTKAPRSATVMAEGETICYILPMKLLEAMEKQAPNMMIKVLMNVGASTARRLAAATNTIKELEQ